MDCVRLKGDGEGTVIFLNGLRYELSYWNEANKKKKINLPAKINCFSSVFLFNLPYEFYKLDFLTLVQKLLELFEENELKKPYILVGHSIGGLISQVLSYLFPEFVKAVLLIDSSFTGPILINRLKTYLETEKQTLKRETFACLIDNLKALEPILKVPEKVPFFSIANIKADYSKIIETFGGGDYKKFYEDFREKLDNHKKITSYNEHSKTILVFDASHAVHHKKPQMVLDLIKELIFSEF
jgi:pimeloyl-ACP methyl ester carboxylesterase